jgi:hypothetical protein
MMRRMTRRTGWQTFGANKPFGFYAIRCGGDSDQSMWLLVFYHRFVFFTDTIPRDAAGKMLMEDGW